MGNEVTAQAGTKGLSFAVPAHLAAAMVVAGGGNIAEKATVPSLTYGGKVWTMSLNGEKKVLQRRNEEGEMENVQVLRVIVLDYAKHRGRSYYEGAFDADTPRQPECWSEDGKRPHASVEAPQHTVCDTCPMAAKGSKIVDGKPTIACSQYRMLAVVPAANLDFEPLRLRLAVTSDWDKSDEEAIASGWYGFQNYTDFLRANGVGFTNALVTRMRFGNANYPKVQFARGDFLDNDAFQKTLEVAQGDAVKKLLSGFAPAGGNGKPVEPKGKALPKDDPEEPVADPVFSKTGRAAEEAQAALTAAAKDAEVAKQYAAVKAADDAKAAAALKAKADAKAVKVAAAKAAAEAAAAAAEAARKAAEGDDDDESGGFDEAPAVKQPEPPKPAPAAAETAPPKKADRKTPPPAPVTAPAEVPPALTGILGEWDA